MGARGMVTYRLEVPGGEARTLRQVVDGTALDPIEAADGSELRYRPGASVVLVFVARDEAGRWAQASPPAALVAGEPIGPPPPDAPRVGVV